MGLENVFLSARPIVESLARSTMWSSTTFFSNSLRVQRARPLGGLEQARAINLASFSPSKIRATAGVARCLRLNTASKPSSASCFTSLYQAFFGVGEHRYYLDLKKLIDGADFEEAISYERAKTKRVKPPGAHLTESAFKARR